MKKLQPHQKRFLKTIILALVIFLLPFIYYQPEYAQLEEADITIERTYYSVGRGRPGSFIMTSDDGIYKIGGDLSSREDFEIKLTPNTNVQIKYYRGIFVVIPMKFIEELTVNGETIVTFHNDQKITQVVFGIAGSIVLIIGFLIYADSAHILKKLRKRFKKHCKKARFKP